MKSCKKIIITASASAVLCLSSCGESTAEIIAPSKLVYFSWWGKDVRNNYTISAIQEFESQNPMIDVIPEYSEWTGFQRRVDIDLASDNEADVMQINYDWLHRYSPDGEDFYDLYELSDYIKLDNFTHEQLEYGTIKGRLNGIPTALNAETFFFNKTVYHKYGLKIPKTWDDLFAAAEVMSADGIYPLEIKLKPMWLLTVAYTEQLTGKHFINENGELEFTDEDIAVMLSFGKSLIDSKVTKPIDDIDKNDFITGKSAGTVCWISDAEYFCIPATDNGYEIEVGDYLTMENSKLFGWYAKPMSLYCIKKDTENFKESAMLLDYLLNSEEMAAAQGIEKGIPLSSSTLEVLEANDMLKGVQFEANEKLDENSERLECINPQLENADMLDCFKAAMDEIYYNNADLNQSAKAFHGQVLKILNG